MAGSRTAWVAGLIGLLVVAAGFSGPAPAQTPPRTNATLLERLERFTSAIFGTRDSPPATSRSPRPTARPAPSRFSTTLGSLTPSATSVEPMPAGGPNTAPRADSAATPAQPAVGQQSAAAEPASSRSPMPPHSTATPQAAAKPSSNERQADASGNAASVPQVSAPAGLQPLHKRLAVLRETLASPSGQAPTHTDSIGSVARGAATSAHPAPRSTLNAVSPAGLHSADTPPGAPAITPPLPSALSAPSSPALSRPVPAGPEIIPPSPSAWGTDRLRSASPDGAWLTRLNPVLVVETLGPRRIAIHQEAAYEFVLRNTGDVAAQQVTLSISVPSWVEVLKAEATAGSTSPAAGASGGQLQWQVGRLEAKGREKLTLRVAARQSRPFELTPTWQCTPAAASQLIEVLEPRLAVMLHGPREVEFGKGELYKLEVQNTGTGDADNVRIALRTQGQSASQPAATHSFGKLAAGQKKSIDVELTARQEGKIVLGIEARGDGNLRAETTEEIVVRRAALKLEIEAPRLQYVGTEATCRLRIHNPGTAAAPKPVLVVTLPAGMRFVSSPQTHQTADSRITWHLDDVPAGGQTVVTFVVAIAAAGAGRIEAQCAAQGGLTASAAAVVQGEAAPSLTLAVEEPSGPVAVGSDATYAIAIHNRGTAPAEQVDVVMYFSHGIEPVSAEGARHRIGPGQVVFDVLPQIPPGQIVTLKVRARAEVAGNPIFRVEVRSQAAGAHLVREGTTRFYGESAKPSALAAPATPANTDPRTARH